LLGVHSRYGLCTRAVTVFRDSFTEGFNYFVTSIVAPVASGWSNCRVGLSTTGKAPPSHGAPLNRSFREIAEFDRDGLADGRQRVISTLCSPSRPAALGNANSGAVGWCQHQNSTH